MRIRQSFGRQESTDSKRPLINDDTDASTLSLASQRTPGKLTITKKLISTLFSDSQNEQTSNEFISRNSSNASKLSRPMAVIVGQAFKTSLKLPKFSTSTTATR